MSNLGNKATMAKNIKRYMSINNVTATDICTALGFPMPTFSDWIREKTYPRIDKIEKMANYFGIQKSDLIEESPAISEDDKALLEEVMANPELLNLLRMLKQIEPERLAALAKLVEPLL